MRTVVWLLLLWSGICVSALAQDDAGPGDAAQHLAVVRLDELQVVPAAALPKAVREGTRSELLTSVAQRNRQWVFGMPWQAFSPRRPPRVILDGAGESLVLADLSRPRGDVAPQARLVVTVPEPRDLRGRIFFTPDGEPREVALDFVLPADAFGSAGLEDWLAAVAADASTHLTADDTGAAWYRHRLESAQQQLGQVHAGHVPARAASERADLVSVQGAFEVFSGGRAVSENLALDRLLPVGADGDADVPLEEVQGLTVSAYDWTELIEGLSPERDPLAALIPEDQHALLLPSFDALLALTDQLDERAAALGRLLEARSQSARTRARYEAQLGLPMSELARIVGPTVIASVALTGGDPYLRTGSDVALLFQPKEPLSALAAISARVHLALAGQPGVERLSGSVEGSAYVGLVNADRSVSSYVATLPGAVVVTNSLTQLVRLASTARGQLPALADTPEYTFFRDRYPRGDAAESALLIVSDATLRRWCGPRVRIGSARRARAAAVLSELTARQLQLDDGPVDHSVELAAPSELPNLGLLWRDASGVRSEAFGNLGFATPIAELDLRWVTEEEQALYERWRQGYETNWARVFDPIALRIGVGGGRLTTDLTVRPLIVDSDYERFIGVARGSAIEPHAGDLHPGTLLQMAVALDSKVISNLAEVGVLKVMLPGLDVFGWIGGSVSYFVDESPFWQEMLAAEYADAFLSERLGDLPVGLQFEVGSGLKLAAFVTAVRALVEGSAPDQLSWETREHGGIHYVAAVAQEIRRGELQQIAVYYSTGPQFFTLSLSEEVIQRTIDRRLARAAARDAGEPDPASSEAPWVGRHMGLRLHVPSILSIAGGVPEGAMSKLVDASHANLPILNEWRRRFPEADPVVTHERWFARTLVCPGGGVYRWNDDWQTMESSVFGHPGAPRADVQLSDLLQDLGQLQLGVEFEEDGLRARADLEIAATRQR